MVAFKTIAGDVVTIKLSENNENVLQTDQTYLSMVVETHFQMNPRPKQ